MSFRKPCHVPFRKLIPPFTLTGGKGSVTYPSYPVRANLSFNFFQCKIWRSVYIRNKKLAPLVGSPCFDVKDTSRSTFLHINTLVLSAQSTLSRRDNQSMCEICCRQSEHVRELLAPAKGSTFFSHINLRLSWLGWEGNPLCRYNVSSYKWALLQKPLSRLSDQLFVVSSKADKVLCSERKPDW